jgi:sigma-B regulation protein RsbU (phosphoserine phosphatase)
MSRRRAAANNAEKLRRIQAVTDAALSSLELDDLLAELLDRTRELLAVDTAAILLLEPGGNELVATAASGLEEEVRQGIRVPVGKGFTGLIAAKRQPIILDHVDRDTVYSQVLIDKHLAVMTGVPMIASNRLLGVLHIGSLTPRQFTDDDIELLRLVADRASLATQARLSRLDRATTLALQRSLLPAHPPAVAGLEVAARYIPGARVGIGGDWYDVFDLPSGHVGIAIGDVAGSGLRAAVVMGRIRSALRAYALESVDPADVLSRLDRKIQRFEPDAMATALYAVVDPDHRRITMSSAGHLPPLLLGASGTRIVEVRPDLPLGAYHHAPRHNTQIDLAAAECLLFYTDGLIERRDQSISEAVSGLANGLSAASPEELCRRAVAQLSHGGATDDVAILAVRRNMPALEAAVITRSSV